MEIAARAARPVDPDPPIARTRIGERPRSRLINAIVRDRPVSVARIDVDARCPTTDREKVMDQIAVDHVARVDRAGVRRCTQALDSFGRKRRARRTDVIVRNGVEAVAESGCGRVEKDDPGG